MSLIYENLICIGIRILIGFNGLKLDCHDKDRIDECHMALDSNSRWCKDLLECQM